MIELLAPAGDVEKLKFAVIYGADAVYFGGETFSLRTGAGNLTVDEMREAITFLHSMGKKGYLTVNIYAHNEDIGPLYEYIRSLKDIDIDAFIVSDPAVMEIIREEIPDAVFHLSTQANTTNILSAAFWKKQGVSRIIAARELTFDEIKAISSELETEVFIHGAMCISYSGRCLLSNYMIGRDANRGMCAHPCRWKYSLMEEKRPGEYYPVEEDDRGTYIMNSKDLCMIEHIPDLIESGVSSFKIEGRMKSIFYVANVVRAYRAAIDSYMRSPGDYVFNGKWMDMLSMASHREFTTGFFYQKPSEGDQDIKTSDYTRDYTFTGIVLDYDRKTGTALIEQRNKMETGQEIDIYGPDMEDRTFVLEHMTDVEGNEISSCPHPQMKLYMKIPFEVKKDYMLCVKKGN